MEPKTLYDDPVEVIERTLRDVIHDVLSLKYGPNWYLDEKIGLGSGWVKHLEYKKKVDEGVLKPEVVFDLPLAYAEFSDLGKLLDKHKVLFAPIFDNWETFMTYYSTAKKLRNIIKHHRDLSSSQYHLLDGIAGEIESAVYLRKIGTTINVKRKIFQFKDLVAIEKKSEVKILSDSAKCISAWKDRLAHAVKCSDLHLSKMNVKKNKFEYVLQGQHISMRIYTSPDPGPKHSINGKQYKGINGHLEVSSDCKANLNSFLKSLGKPYFHIAYDLDKNIDVDALRKWSSECAGLNPSSSGASGEELTSIEYSFLGGKIRMGAWKYAGSLGSKSGRLYATTDSIEGFWGAHNFLDARRLIGFMVGSITPKAMMHLLRMSQIPLSDIKE